MAQQDWQKFLEKKLQLKPGFFFYFPSESEMLVKQSSLGKVLFRLKDPQGLPWVKAAFSKIDGKLPVHEIVSGVTPQRHQELVKVLFMMQQRFLYQDEAQDLDGLPPWLQHQIALRNLPNAWYRDAISEGYVQIIGSGRLGARIAELLSGYGIKQLDMLDAATIGSYDAQRHQAYADAEAGTPRVTYLTQELAKQRGDLQVNGHHFEDLAQLKTLLNPEATLWIVALDSYQPSMLETVNAYALETKSKWIFALVDAWRIFVGPTFIPHESGCMQCLQQQFTEQPDIETLPQSELPLEHLDLDLVNPAFADIAAGMVVADFPHVHGNMPGQIERDSALTLSRQMIWDMTTYNAHLRPLFKFPNCQACGKA